MPTPTPESILIVYDSHSIRETVSVLGIDSNYPTVSLDDPALLMETLEQTQPALVILCAMTKKTTAFDSCRTIKAATRGVFLPVVIYALKGDNTLQRKAYEAGADDIAQVTLASETLLCRLDSLLRIRHVVQESQQRTANMARASAEAADMMLQLEEADRQIREQNDELKERDRRIHEQQAVIEQHLETLQLEMELASSLQLNLLPSTYPEAEGLSLYDRYIPAAELCGDYYDYVSLPDGTFWVTIADVTGHGVAPALVSVQVRTMARTAIQTGKSPTEVLSELNKFMANTFKQDFLMTMACLQYDPVTHSIIYAGAGHCPLIWLNAAGTINERYSHGLPLGVTESAPYTGEEFTLAPGDKLLLYTDGLTEIEGETKTDQFGVERLLHTFTACQATPGRDTLDALLRAARQHSADGMFKDDVTLVLLERDI